AVSIPFSRGRRLNPCRFRSRIGLGDAKSLQAKFSAGDLWQITSLLFFVAVPKQGSHGVHLRVTYCGDAAGAVDLFKNDAGFGDSEAGAAVLFRNQRRQPAEFRKLTDKGLGIVFLAVDLTPIGVRKFATNFANLIADLKLFLAQVEIHWRLLYLPPSSLLKKAHRLRCARSSRYNVSRNTPPLSDLSRASPLSPF